ncbi:diguanylate cyclase [Altererythrobacter sp. CC-YST694]|uniref:diguanylate cyclase domain-containing protein n=1 Tax=Altererythrobacter sp. CC-YST694 TaxID=2755038 RepID=UPI001D017027|nr:diguanylate cyclase [Altererythrobacter sp. CC-YST694]MCB5423881.1 diguanylate cyclase [Altererythrobacter sp. CC-YST694]
MRTPTLHGILARAHGRLILAAVLIAGITVLFCGASIIRDHAARNLELIARTLSYSVEPALVFGDKEAILEGIHSVADNGAVARIEVTDAEGRLLASWSGEDDNPLAWIERLGSKILWSQPFRLPIERGGEKIGEVRVTGSAAGIERFILQGVLIVFCCMGIAAVATRILARKLHSGVIAPLNHVADVAHSVRTERAFHRRVPAAGLVEIDNFVEDFNGLLAEIQSWYDGLTEENEELARLARHDALTGLGNRVLFERHLDAAVEGVRQKGWRFALLYLDGNDFKRINDCHGHEAGDKVLQAIAERLRQSVRQADHVFRLGGDEFAIILGAPIENSEVDAIVARIDQAMDDAVDLGRGGFAALSVSVGYVICPDHGEAPAELVRKADEAMYRDKIRRNSNGFI